jgi:endonuclease-3
MNKEKISKIFEIFQKSEPEPETELNYTSAYSLLVAIALSAQSTDVAVNKATPALFKAAPTPEKMVKLGEEKLRSYIKTIGLYNSKAKNIIALSQLLIDEHGGKVPESFDELIKLPGVGTKTANVFLNCFHKHPVIAVDTHVFRVSNRIGLVKTKTADETADKLNKVIPEQFRMHAHHWLILHGRYICVARKPKCAECKIYSLCEYKEKTA